MLNTEGPVIASLAADYPVLYLNPDTDSIETYRHVVLNGEVPGSRSLGPGVSGDYGNRRGDVRCGVPLLFRSRVSHIGPRGLEK